MRPILLATASFLILTASVVAQTRPPVPVVVNTPAPEGAQTVPLIRIGDVFEMRLSGMPQDLAAEFAIQYTVGQDGTANIPLIGEMKVSGLSANQAEREIQTKLVSEKIFIH